jgi:glycosyltransferase involved in cell wall biosynthesis
MKLSIVVLTWNSRPFIRACLESLAAQAPPRHRADRGGQRIVRWFGPPGP